MATRVMKAVSGSIAAQRAARGKRIIAAIRQNPPSTQSNMEAAVIGPERFGFSMGTRSFLQHN